MSKLSVKYLLKKAEEKSSEKVVVNSEVIIQEHPGVDPVSYMAKSNIVTMQHGLKEIVEMMNPKDDLPQWVDQALSEAADRVEKARKYIMSEKVK